MGSATAWHLARDGREVVLLEQFEQGHVRGSSHGGSRIFRLAYDDAMYVRMARDAGEWWREFEDDASTTVLETTGGIDFGDASAVASIIDALVEAGVGHHLLGPSEAAERFPGFSFDGAVLWQPDAGRLLADLAVRTFQERAEAHGAQVLFKTPMSSFKTAGDGVIVTSADERYEAGCVVVTAGAWVNKVLAGHAELPPIEVTREQIFHFQPEEPGMLWPSFIDHRSPGIYGLESPGEGVKVAEHHTGPAVDPDERTFDVDEVGRKRVTRYVERTLPGLSPVPASAATCLYTSTPDHSFVIERQGPVVIGSPCSGHGFKFTPLIGRRLADLANDKG